MDTSRIAVQTIDAPPRYGAGQRTTRYVDIADPRLATRLEAEDLAEDAGLDPFERTSCRVHRRWLHQCIHSAVHVVVVSGYRWCRACEEPAAVAVDELTGDIRVMCPRCGRTPPGHASRQIVRTCTASLAAAQDGRPQLSARVDRGIPGGGDLGRGRRRGLRTLRGGRDAVHRSGRRGSAARAQVAVLAR